MLKTVATTFRSLSNLSTISIGAARPIGTTSILFLKEIKETQDGDIQVFEGVPVKSPREEKLLSSDNEHGSCSLCALGLDVKHTDVLIIKQFLDHDAKIYPRRFTGLCRYQQRKMVYLIEMATRAGLINSLVASHPIPAYQRGWRKYNSYFEESEIPTSRAEYAIMKQRKFEEAYKIAKAERDAHEEMLKKRREERMLSGH